jgi:cysteinyl-tRNA synthetase
MSKSLGNVRGIAEITAEMPGDTLRLLFLQTHYRAPLDFSGSRLDEGRRALERLCEALARCTDLPGAEEPPALDGMLARPESDFERAYCEALDDDLNAAKGLGLVFDRVRDLNRALDAGDVIAAREAYRDVTRASAALGLLSRPAAELLAALKAGARARLALSPEAIEALVAERTSARKTRDFARADAIRDRLASHGIVLTDGPAGTTWDVV